MTDRKQELSERNHERVSGGSSTFPSERVFDEINHLRSNARGGSGENLKMEAHAPASTAHKHLPPTSIDHHQHALSKDHLQHPPSHHVGGSEFGEKAGSAKHYPAEISKHHPAEGAHHHPGEISKHHPVEGAHHHPGEISKHHPAEITKHHPSEITRHHPAEAAKHNPAEKYEGHGDSSSPSRTGFSAALLARLGAPATAANMALLDVWQKAEGGSSENPFNTTLRSSHGRAVNSAGVERYDSMTAGLNATVSTLNEAKYRNIVAALRKGQSAHLTALAIKNSSWGTSNITNFV
jgi:hypothetical protein